MSSTQSGALPEVIVTWSLDNNYYR